MTLIAETIIILINFNTKKDFIMKRAYSVSDSAQVPYYQPNGPIAEMPQDITLLFFANLPSTSMTTLSSVCKSWKQILSNEHTFNYLFHAHYPNANKVEHESYKENYERQLRQLRITQNLSHGLYTTKLIILPLRHEYRDFFIWKEKFITVDDDCGQEGRIAIYKMSELLNGEMLQGGKVPTREFRTDLEATSNWVHENGKLYVGIKRKLMELDLNQDELSLRTIWKAGKEMEILSLSIRKNKIAIIYEDWNEENRQNSFVLFDILKGAPIINVKAPNHHALDPYKDIKLLTDTTISVRSLSGTKVEVHTLLTTQQTRISKNSTLSSQIIFVDGAFIYGYSKGEIAKVGITETKLQNSNKFPAATQPKTTWLSKNSDPNPNPDIEEFINMGNGNLLSRSQNGNISLWDLRTDSLLSKLEEWSSVNHTYRNNPMLYDNGRLFIGNPKKELAACPEAVCILDFCAPLKDCLDEIHQMQQYSGKDIESMAKLRFDRLPPRLKEKYKPHQ